MRGHELTSKIPPQNTELEEAILGSLMLERDAYLEIESVLTPEVFYSDRHQLIYQAIQSLHKRNAPVDILTVSNEINIMGRLEDVGGRYYITNLTSKVSSSAHIGAHAHIIFEMYLKRQVITLSMEMNKEAYGEETDALDLVSSFASKAEALADVSAVNDEIKEFGDNLLEALLAIENTKVTHGVSGVPTGFHNLDKLFQGWQKGDLIVWGGRPGMGKTSAVVQLTINAAKMGFPVAFFTLEIAKLQLVMKMQSNESEIPFERIRGNLLGPDEWEKLQAACDRLSRLPIYIDDTSKLSVRSLKSKCRKLKRQGKLKMIVVDFIQLMNGSEGVNKNANRDQEVSYISSSLKALAKELDVPVIALSSLNRESEKRGGSKEPRLSDLRESGSLESDADIVILLHRPEYYDISEFSDGSPTENVAELIIDKYRNGSTGRAYLKFFKSISKFTEMDTEFIDPSPVKINFSEPAEKEIPTGANLNQYALDDTEGF